MPKIPGINQRDAVRIFEKLGYHIARQSGHIVMTNGKQRLVIPRHNPINAITMGAIAKRQDSHRMNFADCFKSLERMDYFFSLRLVGLENRLR